LSESSAPSLNYKAHAGDSPESLVDELESVYHIKIKGKLRILLLNIAALNLEKKYPVMREVMIMGVSYEAHKKMYARAKQKGLIVTHPKKKGRSDRYVLSTIQDIDIDDKPKRKLKPSQEIMNVNEILLGSAFCIDAVKQMLNRTSIEFHHITITTSLQVPDDYRYFKWDIPSKKNKAKVMDFPLSRLRGCKITLYPNGRIIVVIYSSKYPFNLFSYEGLIEFNTVCGQIYEHIVKFLRVKMLLTSEPLDWEVTQIDGAYDIKVVDLQRALDRLNNQKISLDKGGYISFRFPKPHIKIRYLHQLFQIYTKRLPYKGECLRLENRLSFDKSYPRLRDIVYNYSVKADSHNRNNPSSPAQAN
jgi:hypothetical protein